MVADNDENERGDNEHTDGRHDEMPDERELDRTEPEAEAEDHEKTSAEIPRAKARHPATLQILVESWALTTDLRAPILKKCLLTILLAGPVYMAGGFMMGFAALMPMPLSLLGVILSLFLQIVAGVIAFYFFNVPATMLGVRASIGLDISMNKVNADIAKVKNVLLKFILYFVSVTTITYFILSVLQDVLIGKNDLMITIVFILISLALFIIFLPIYYFSIPLMITKNIDGMTAVKSAYHKMRIVWVPVILTYIIMMIVSFVFYLLAGICLALFMMLVTALLGKLASIVIGILLSVLVFLRIVFVLLAWYYAVIGVIFRDVYGLRKD